MFHENNSRQKKTAVQGLIITVSRLWLFACWIKSC